MYYKDPNTLTIKTHSKHTPNVFTSDGIIMLCSGYRDVVGQLIYEKDVVKFEHDDAHFLGVIHAPSHCDEPFGIISISDKPENTITVNIKDVTNLVVIGNTKETLKGEKNNG